MNPRTMVFLACFTAAVPCVAASAHGDSFVEGSVKNLGLDVVSAFYWVWDWDGEREVEIFLADYPDACEIYQRQAQKRDAHGISLLLGGLGAPGRTYSFSSDERSVGGASATFVAKDENCEETMYWHPTRGDVILYDAPGASLLRGIFRFSGYGDELAGSFSATKCDLSGVNLSADLVCE